MNKYKVIRVRYLNSDKTLSRPQKLKRITDDSGKHHYYKINSKQKPAFEIDEKSFITSWPKKAYEHKATVKQESTWEIIRVKMKVELPNGTTKYTRPKRIYKITLGNEVSYCPMLIKGSLKRISDGDFITEWDRAGKTPTPRPLRKYSDQSLKEMGYTIEEIKRIRERSFSSKDIDIVAKKLKIKRVEAKELLIKYEGKKHTIYESEEVKKIKK